MKKTTLRQVAFKLACVAIALFAPLGLRAQETVTIGDGTVTCNTNPIGTYYNYSIAEQLYTAEEIGMAGTIESISFYYRGIAAKDLPITMYMKHVTEANLASGGITLADADEVFSGTLSVTTTAGWVTINLDTPFDYDGTSNLLIGFIKDYLYYFNGQSWQGTATASTMARYTQNDYNAYTTSTTPGTEQVNRPNIQLVITPASSDCPNPNSFVISDVATHTAVATWGMNDATYVGNFNLQYKKTTDGDDAWTSVPLGNVRTYTLTGLDAETEYQTRIQTVCTPENTYWKNATNFTTLVACPAPTNLAVTDGSISATGATVTWNGTSSNGYVVMIGQENLAVSADFEGQTIPAEFTTTSYPWTVTAGGANGSGYCAIPGNHGVNSSLSDLTLEVTLDNPATVSFNAKVSSESGWDKGFFLIDGTEMMQISGTQNWIAYSFQLTAGTHTFIWRYHKDSSGQDGDDLFYVDDIVVSAGVDSWTEYTTNSQTYTFDNLTPNRHYQVKVKGNCGDEGYSQASAPVSFTTLESCPMPTGLTVSNITGHEATISWTSAAEAWQICVNDDEENLIDVTETTYNFTGLTPETTYSVKVRTNCGEAYSDWKSVTFTTDVACPAPTGFAVAENGLTGHTADLTWEGTSNSYQVAYRTAAYVDGLEEGFGSTIPEGWTRYNTLLTDDVLNGTTALTTYNGGWVVGTSNGVFDSHARVNIYGTGYKYWLVTPTLTVPAGATFSFDLALTAYSGSNVPAPATTGTDDRFIVLVSTDEMATWTILREWNNSGSEYVYNNIANTATGENVSFDFSAYAGQTVYVAFYGESTVNNADNNLHIDNVTIGIAVPAGEMQYASNITEQTVTLQGLLAETEYEAWLQGDCGSEGPSTEVGPITFTTDVACPAPTGLTASNITGHEATISWTSAADAWQICVNDDEENLIAVTETTYNITGLAPETAYTVKVRANCGDEGYSGWTNNVSFTTDVACPAPTGLTVSNITNNAATVAWEGTHDNYQVQYRTAETSQLVVSEGSYYDDFENGLDNWTIYQEGEAGGNWSITDPSTWNGSRAAHSGSYVAVARSYNGSSAFNADNWLVSPQVTIPASMSYWVMGNSYYPETYAICVSTTGNAVADFTPVIEYTDNPNEWTLVTVDLSAYAGQTGYIAFHQYGYDADYLWIDDVNIGCATVVTPAGEWITIETADLAAELTGLEASTTYEYQVRGYCAEEDTWTDWTDMATFTTLSPCAVPTALEATNIEASTATLGWTGYQESFNVRYRTAEHRTTYYFTNFNTDADRTGWTWEGYIISGMADPIYGYPGSENYFLQMGWSTTEEAYIISDELPAYGSDAVVEFYYFGYSTANTFQVGYSSTTNDASAFTWSDPIEAPLMTYTLFSEALPTGTKYVAFKATASDQTATIFIDNFGVFGAVTPAGEWVNATTTEATLNVTGLTPEATYEWQVQGVNSVCDDGVTEWSAVSTFTTLALDANRWYAISSPRHDAGQTYESVPNVTNLIPATGAYDLYYYNESNTTWMNYKPEEFNLEQGHGYIYRRSTASPALDFTGEDNTADVAVQLTATPEAGSLMGFNLVGNPFLRNYTLNRDCYNLTINGVWTVNEGSYTLGIAEAVMVKATSDETLTFTYNEEENVGAKAGRSAALAFTLAGNGFEDVAYARFADGEGMPKLGHLNSEAPMLSIALDNRRYAIANLDYDCQSFPLVLRAKTGEYTLTAGNTEQVAYLHLIDRATGSDIDLLANGSYTFNATSNDADRFTVKLSPDALDNAGSNFVYWNGTSWTVEGNGTLGVYDVMGRQLFSGEVNSQLSIQNSQFPSTGVYILRLGEKSQKIVVK